jgi:hypothetical protein
MGVDFVDFGLDFISNLSNLFVIKSYAAAAIVVVILHILCKKRMLL